MTASSTQCSQRVHLREASNISVTQIASTARTLATTGLLVVVLMSATAVVGVGAVAASPGLGITSSATAEAESKIFDKNNGRRARQAEGAGSCAVAGCSLCSDTNGCLRCESSHYLLLVRSYMQQRGACVLSCPVGHYPNERDVPPDVEPPLPTMMFRKCHKCNIRSCAACHSRHYCTHCISPSIAFRGQCYDPCTAAEAASNVSVADCPPNAECSAGPWSPWATSSSSSKPPLGGAGAWPAAGLLRKLGLVKSRSRDVLVRRKPGGTTYSSGLLLPCIVRAVESRPCGGDGEAESAADGCDPSSFQSDESSAPPPPPAAAQGTAKVSDQVRNDYKPRKRKPRPGTKPPRSCAIEAESGATAAITAAAAQPCHRVRHSGRGGREKAGSTTSAAPTRNADAATSPRDKDAPPSDCGCLLAVPAPTQLPPTSTGSSISERPPQQTSTLEAYVTSPHRSAATGPLTTTRGSPLLLTPPRFAEPPAAGDLLSAHYYNYYLRLAKQLLRNRQSTGAVAAPEQPPSG